METESDSRAPDEPAQTPFPSGAACAATTRLLAKFIAGEIGESQSARMRLHISQCEACSASYRSGMETAASLGRRVRLEREARNRARRHDGIKERAFQATADRHAGRRYGLRLALLPAGLALIMILWRSGGGGATLVAEWESGEGWVAGQAVGAEQARFVLSPGDWVETENGGSVRIVSAPGDSLEFGLSGDCKVQVEDLVRHQVHLQEGSLTARGACRVTTSLGVLEVFEGSARVSIVGRGFLIECLEGESNWIGPAGERRLEGGQRISDRSMLAHVR